MKHEKNNDKRKVILFKIIGEIYLKMGYYETSREYHEKIIEICEKYPKSEDMLLLKIDSLTKLKKKYKSIECAGELLKINPYNTNALLKLSQYLK